MAPPAERARTASVGLAYIDSSRTPTACTLRRADARVPGSPHRCVWVASGCRAPQHRTGSRRRAPAYSSGRRSRAVTTSQPPAHEQLADALPDQGARRRPPRLPAGRGSWRRSLCGGWRGHRVPLVVAGDLDATTDRIHSVHETSKTRAGGWSRRRHARRRRPSRPPAPPARGRPSRSGPSMLGHVGETLGRRRSTP